MSQEDTRRDIEQTIADIEALAARSESHREEFRQWMVEAAKRQEQFLAELTEAADRPLPSGPDRIDKLSERVRYLEGFTQAIAPSHWWELIKTILIAVAFVLSVVAVLR